MIAAVRQVGGLALHVAEGGAGAPLVLVHGVARGWRDLAPLLPHLLPRWRVIAYDQRGHGASARAASYLVRDYVDDLIALLAGLDRPALVYGHSLGAQVALEAALRAPRLVRALALEEPPFHAMGRRIHGSPWQRLFTGYRACLTAPADVPALARRLAALTVDDRRGGETALGCVRDATALRALAAHLSTLDPAVLDPLIAGRWLDGCAEPAPWPALGCPVLLLHGDPAAGAALADADAERLAAAGDVIRIRFAGAGHQLHWERAGELANHLVRFLDAVAAAPHDPTAVRAAGAGAASRSCA